MSDSAPAKRPPLSAYFKILEPGEKPAPPPKQLTQWTSQMFSGLFFGMAYGGYQGLVDARHPAGALDPAPGEPSPFTNHRHRASAYFVRGSILHGARIGSFVALLSAATLTLDAYLQVEGTDEDTATDPRALAAGAGATCALYGGAVGGGLASVQAGLFGAAVGGAAGLIQKELAGVVSKLEREAANENPKDAEVLDNEGHLTGDEAAGKALQDVVRWLEAGQDERRVSAAVANYAAKTKGSTSS